MTQGDGSQITVEPGLIGGEVNRILAAHKNKHNHPVQYKIGPDPSSIDSCMVRLSLCSAALATVSSCHLPIAWFARLAGSRSMYQAAAGTLQVGGMVSNNSSGMCCGVSQNTYHTLKDMRVVFADGTVLDTADPASRSAFLKVCTLFSQTSASSQIMLCWPWYVACLIVLWQQPPS